MGFSVKGRQRRSNSCLSLTTVAKQTASCIILLDHRKALWLWWSATSSRSWDLLFVDLFIYDIYVCGISWSSTISYHNIHNILIYIYILYVNISIYIYIIYNEIYIYVIDSCTHLGTFQVSALSCRILVSLFDDVRSIVWNDMWIGLVVQDWSGGVLRDSHWTSVIENEMRTTKAIHFEQANI